MKFDLENLNPGVFFEFGDDDKGGVTIRLANGEILDKINTQCQKKKIEFKKGQRFEVIESNEELRSKMLWDYVIVGWEGIVDSEDKEIKCTKENKVLLMKSSPKFSTFVGACVEKLSEDTENFNEVLEKNLLT